MNKTSHNKDYVINLRVSRDTYEKIKRKAKENSETISDLVRKAIDDSAEIISDISNEIFGKEKRTFEDVLSYHEAEIAKGIECARCRKEILAGTMAWIGEAGSGKRYYFCQGCKR